jgi:hypothetical protein
MKYICNECNYETCDKSHFDRHKNTKKHVQNAQNMTKQIYKIIGKPKVNQKLTGSKPKIVATSTEKSCKLCGNIFSCKQSLSRHINHRCKLKTNEPVVKKLEIMIDTLEKQNQTLGKQNEKLMNIVEKQTNTAENNSETIKKSINVLSFVTKQYPNAPPIEELEYDKFNKITKCLMYDRKNKKKIKRPLEEIILFHFKNDDLCKVLGKAIVEEYKKDDPEDQSMWASDVSRLTFIVKNAIGKNKKSKWISDKNGVHFTELIIKPMFEIIKEKMREYIKNGGLKESEIRDEDIDNITIRLANMQLAGELIRLINLNKYDGKVLKYVAPYFNLIIDSSDSESEESDGE